MTHSNRRGFLQSAGALGLASGAGALANLAGAGAALGANVGGYKALVCVFLFGGMDQSDTVFPHDVASYNQLAGARPELFRAYRTGPAAMSRNRENLLRLSPANHWAFVGRQFALPRQLRPLHQLFQSGDAAIVGGVGPLVRRVTRTQIENGSAPLPPRLFSHNDQQSTWLSLAPEGASSGWGGEFLDAALAARSGGPDYAAINAGANTPFLTGETTRPFQIGPNGAQSANLIQQRYRLGTARNSDQAVRLMRAHIASENIDADNYFVQDVVSANTRAIRTNGQFNRVVAQAHNFRTRFPNTSIGAQLRSVARTISLRGALGVGRQVFFVSQGGFDTHSRQTAALPALHTQLADGIAAFHAAMGELNLNQNVTLFTGADFGRTLNDNGDGTDHGWGGHHFVVGGAVNGRRIYGALARPNPQSEEYTTNRGRLIPSVSVDQYAATLGSWFGISDNELARIFPNLSNFNRRKLSFL